MASSCTRRVQVRKTCFRKMVVKCWNRLVRDVVRSPRNNHSRGLSCETNPTWLFIEKSERKSNFLRVGFFTRIMMKFSSVWMFQLPRNCVEKTELRCSAGKPS